MTLSNVPTLFDRFFVDFDHAFGPRTACARPAMDLIAYPDRIELVADLPGLSREDVDLQVADGVLTVRAERGLEVPADGRVVRRERSARTFSRSFALSDEVDVDAIGATMRDGVLRITLPKSERVKPRQIEVAVN